jgi:phenylacetate-CoA ligase
MVIEEILELWRQERRRRWTPERKLAWREARLRELVAHAYEQVPYYREVMQRAGLRPADIRHEADLRYLPVTRKQDLRDAGDAALARNAGPIEWQQTAGSSGEPFRVAMTHEERVRRRLREFRALRGIGVRPLDSLVILGTSRTRPQRLHRRLRLYPLLVIPYGQPPREQAELIRRAKPDVLWFFPTVLKQVLSEIGQSLSHLARPRLLISSASVLDEAFRRQLLEDLPGAKLGDFYGSTEIGRIAAGCPRCDGLHLEDDALIFELLEAGTPVSRGEEGCVVVTNLDQKAMPLIRYDQGDRCRIRPAPCPCGLSSPLLDPPLGRNPDMLLLPSGKRLSAAGLDILTKDIPGVLQYRFVQTKPGAVDAQFCFVSQPDAAFLERVAARVRAALPEPMEVAVTLFGRDEMTGPKFKSVVCTLLDEGPGGTVGTGGTAATGGTGGKERA